MKVFFVSIAVLVASAFAKLDFVAKDGSHDENPILLEYGRRYTYLQNGADSSITISRTDVRIVSPGVEESWYFNFDIDRSYSAGSDSGKQVAISDVLIGKMNSKAMLYFNEYSFEARNWGEICSDYYVGKYRCSLEEGKASKNTANEHDTIDVQMIFYWYYTDYPRRDSNKVIQLDSTILPCRLEYFRGPTSSELTSGISRRGARSKDGIRSVPNGWQVPTGGRWTLRNLQGREIPLRQESTNDGVLLLPQGLRGVGVLTGPNGQSSKVHSLGGN